MNNTSSEDEDNDSQEDMKQEENILKAKIPDLSAIHLKHKRKPRASKSRNKHIAAT